MDIKKKLNLRSEQLCDIWILYIKDCSKKLDLYEYIQDNGIGLMNASMIIDFAQFLELGGQPDPSGNAQFCIFDYRYARKIYTDAQSTIKFIQSDLTNFSNTIPGLNDIEQGLFDIWSNYEVEWLQDQFDRINKAYINFCENMENLLVNDMNPRVNWCKQNKQNRRNFFEAKSLCEKHNKLYSRVA